MARRLRRQGVPIKQIAREVGVSQGTVSVWVRDISLSPEQHAENKRRAGATRGSAWRERHRAVRRLSQEEGRVRALEADPLHLAGCMLYWSEGAKSRNMLRFCNSDLAMVTFFKRFISECFEVAPEDFVVVLNVYLSNGLTIREIEDHWLESLDLPRSCLRKHQLNHMPTSSSGGKTNKLPYGVCSLTVKRGTSILQHIYGAIQQYAGFEEASWLDGHY